MWGEPGSGKTTFLLALYATTLEKRCSWSMHPEPGHPKSGRFLIEQYRNFQYGRLPAAATTSAAYSFELSGEVKLEKPGVFGRTREFTDSHMINLIVQDYAPDMYHCESIESTFEETSRLLTGSDGIVYLFDATRPKDSYDYFQEIISRMMSHSREANRLAGSSLPNYIAVCVNKYDDERILLNCQNTGIIIVDHIPVLLNAKVAFEQLAEYRHNNLLQGAFLKDRIAYFGTSAIGFRPQVNGSIVLSDCSNLLDSGDGFVMRAKTRPVGLIEPLAWHASRMSGMRR